jgi:hypothetical protein
MRQEPHRKRRLQQFFVAAGTSLMSSYQTATGGYTDPQTRTSQKMTRQTIRLLLRVSAARGRVYRAVS